MYMLRSYVAIRCACTCGFHKTEQFIELERYKTVLRPEYSYVCCESIHKVDLSHLTASYIGLICWQCSAGEICMKKA